VLVSAHLLVLTALIVAGTAQGAGPRVDPRLIDAIGWYTGTAGRVDDPRARQLIEATALDGDVLGRMWLARAYSRGRLGLPRDEARARAMAAIVVDAVRRQADRGSAEAQFLVGTAFDEGLGVPEDPQAAIVWFRKAAAQDHTLAQHNLGNAFAAGRGVTADATEAVRWWLLAGQKGDAVVQLRLGEAYEHGTGAPRDLAQARRWYGDAAGRGNAQAKAALERLAAGLERR
jgi:TPR repeat protein